MAKVQLYEHDEYIGVFEFYKTQKTGTRVKLHDLFTNVLTYILDHWDSNELLRSNINPNIFKEFDSKSIKNSFHINLSQDHKDKIQEIAKDQNFSESSLALFCLAKGVEKEIINNFISKGFS